MGCAVSAIVAPEMQQDDDGECSFNLFVVVEKLRLVAYCLFGLVLLVAFILTKAFVNVPEDNFLGRVFGTTNSCIILDFPPVTYVAPALWVGGPMLAFLAYCAASAVRARIAQAEKKISARALRSLNSAYGFTAFCLVCFTTCFATSPDEDKPVTMVIHTLSFTALMVALAALQTAVWWFGAHVGWKEAKLPGWYEPAAFAHVVLQWIFTVAKAFIHVNGLADMNGSAGRGKWFRVRNAVAMAKVLDICWMVLAVVIPTIQSAHLTHIGLGTHGVLVKLSDNRRAQPGAVPKAV